MQVPRRLRPEYESQIANADKSSKNNPQLIDYSKQALEKVKIIGQMKSRNAKWWASFFQWTNTIISVWIILADSLIFIMELLDKCQNIGIIITTASIAIAKTFHSMFQVGNRGSYFKYIFIRFNSMLDDIEEAKLFLRSSNERILFSRHIKEEIDRLDMEMYKLTAGPEMITTTIDGNVEYDYKKASNLV